MFDDLKNKAEASGIVKIILSNKSVIYADNVKADFTGKDKSLEKAIANGNVIIENKEKGRTFEDQTAKRLQLTFEPLTDYLGFLIEMKNNVCMLTQPKNIQTTQPSGKRVYTPMKSKDYKESIRDQANQLIIKDTRRKQDYMETIGQLLYIARHSRPDIIFAVSYLARFQQQITSISIPN